MRQSRAALIAFRCATTEATLVGGAPAFREQGGGHTTGPNRPAFPEFALRYFPGR